MKRTLYRVLLSFALIIVVTLPAIRVAQLRYDAHPLRVFGGQPDRAVNRGDFALRSDSGPEAGLFEPLLLEHCTKNWERRATWGALSPTRAALDCWLERYPDASFVLLQFRDRLYNPRTETTRTVEYEWEYERLESAAWYTQVIVDRRQRVWMVSELPE